jgi:polysaccharide pyruvyl transferase WcaK-like protein
MDRVTKRIGLLDHVGGGNLGDDATLAAVIQNITLRWPHAQMAGFSMNPVDTEKRHGIRSYAIRRTTLVGSNPFLIYFDLDGDASSPGKRVDSFASRMKSSLRKHRLLFRVLKLLKLTVIRAPKTFFAELSFLFKSYRILRSFDLLVISGGGQLLDCWGGPWEFPYTIWKWLVLARLARVKRVFLNVGAGPLEHPLSIFFVMRALRLADYTSFRDWKSQTLIQQIGFTARSNVVADCVYSLATPACHTGTKGKPGNGIVGISPMAYCHPGVYWKKDRRLYDSFIEKLSAFGSALIGSGHRIVLFTTDIWFDSQTIEDLKNALEAEIEATHRSWVTVKHVETTEALLSTMCLMDYVVTCRFHGVVFAHLLNKPVLAISHHPKVATLMNDIGLADYCVDMDRFDSDLLLRRFSLLVRNAESIKGVMAETLDGYRRKLASQFDDLFPRGTPSVTCRDSQFGEKLEVAGRA